MKERVTAVALLLVIAITMMISATFAWMTLSRSPEASSIFTTVSTNGNLEIALSGTEGLMPPESGIGDGGRDITETNLTWGNLINLSDIDYGLKDIVLRPASLNTKTLATSPMYAVQYGADGRVLGYLYDFLYANYVEDPDSGVKYFAPEEDIKYGVRAISTVTYEDIGTDAVLVRKIEAMQASLIEAKQNFQNIYDIENSDVAEEYMKAVGGLVGVHVDKTLNGGSPDASAYMTGLYNLTNAFLLCVVDMGEVLVEGANLCVFMSLEDRSDYDELAFTFEDLIEGRLTNQMIEQRCGGQYDVNFTCIEDFLNLWKMLAGYDGVLHGVNEEWKPEDENGEFFEKITLPAYSSNYKEPTVSSKAIYGAYEVILAKYQDYRTNVMNGADNQTVPWDNWMIMAVNQMCNMDSATIQAGNGKPYTAADLLQLKADRNLGALMPFGGSGPFHAKINDGAIQDVGQLLGKPLDVPSSNAIRIKATVNIASLNWQIPIDMKPSISAAYDQDGNVLDMDIEEAKRVASGGSNYKGVPTAAETYAMVIDFWIRTNAENTLLTLEGELIYDQKAGTASDGRKVGLLFSYTETDSETQLETTHYVYQNQDKYYYDYELEGNNEELTAAQVSAIKEQLKPVYEDKPSGYEGANRVWDELKNPNNQYVQNMLQHNGTSTTQGSGSCYIFYPQSAEDQRQSLKLLSSMRVAFVDATGTLLATAYMDTANAVEDAGRVIVPLCLRANDTPVIDATGALVNQYITPLMKNEAKRISAIVYLEGDYLKNSEVLAAGSITGQMNIQFGTTDVKLNAVDDGEVMEEFYTFDFTLDGNRDGNINEQEQDRDYEIPVGQEWMVDLYLDLGETATPELVEGNFVSVINATQGARQEEFVMRRSDETGLWEAYHYVESEDSLVAGTYVKGVPFSGPGNHQLRSIRIDGVDYLLKDNQIVKIKVPGMAVSALTWDDTVENSKHWRTADSQWPEKLKLKLESDDFQIHKIQGVFLGDNGQNVTVNFTSPSGDGVNYEGIATFPASGNYTLTYVYIDGALVPLDAELYKTIDLQLGLQVEIGYTIPKIMESELEIPDGLTEAERAEYIAEILKDISATPKLCYFRYNRMAPLEMNMWCKIYDDQDNELRELEGLELWFGTAANPLDTDLVWNEDAGENGRYEGTFKIEKNGIYNFNALILDDGSAITKAVSAPVIQSASPDPVEYVHFMNKYPVLTYDLDLPASQRVLQFKLRNSQGAAIKVALSNTLTQDGIATVEASEEESAYTIIDNMDEQYKSWWTESQPDNNGVVTYTLTLPSDGYWEIAGLYLGGGAYYGGQLWSGETDEDWADLSELVQSDNIKTYYLTQLNISASGLPKHTNAEFMQTIKGSNDCDITIKVENQGKPLARVLQEVSEMFPDEQIDPSVVIELEYAYSKWSDQKWSVPSGTTLPMTLNGGKMENGVFTMNAKFQTEGDYTPNFKLTIGGEPYNGDQIPQALKSTNEATVTVRWKLPEVKITGVSTDTHDGVELYGGEIYNGVSNYYEDYYAGTYFYVTGEFLGQNFFEAPKVEMGVTFGRGNATSVKVTASSSSFNTTYTLNASNSWKESRTIGSTTNLGATRQTAGTVTAKTVVLGHDSGNYTFTLPAEKNITINNAAYPHYLVLNESQSQVELPNTINCYDYNGNLFTVDAAGKSSVRIFSPDGRAFSVDLPTMKKVVEGRIELSTTSATYDNIDGYAVEVYKYTTWKEEEKSGCDTVDVTYFQQYQQWQRVATVSGVKKTYRDTYQVETWSGKQAGTRVTVSSTSTWSADSVKTTAELVSTENLSDTVETQIKYVKKGNKTQTKPAGDPVGSEAELPLSFPG